MTSEKRSLPEREGSHSLILQEAWKPTMGGLAQVASFCPDKRSIEHIECNKCHKKGHYANRCMEHGSDAWNENGNQNICVYYGGQGHVISQCRTKLRGDKVRASMATHETDIDPSNFTASYAVMIAPLALSASDQTSSLILDSGASEHFIPARSSFESYDTDIPLSKSFIYTADNNPHEVKGHGVVRFQLHQGDATSVVRIHALHVPTLKQHFISMLCLNQRGGVDFILSSKDGPSLMHDGEIRVMSANQEMDC